MANLIPSRSIRMFYFYALVLLLVPGCAVLTPSQIKEVNRFAKAAEQYGTYPGVVVTSFADIRMTRQLLDASSFTNGAAAWQELESAVSNRKKYNQVAERADRSLNVLNDYAQLLVKLTSDEYTTSLEASTENLAKSIDSGVKLYNESYGTQLNSFGAVVATIVRAGGGILIRRKQAEALRTAVISADPIVEEMTRAVEALLSTYLPPSQSQPSASLITNEVNALEGLFQNIVTRAQCKAQSQCTALPLSTAVTIAQTLSAADETARLARAAKTSAVTYREAHAELKAEVLERLTLESAIEQVETLVQEVKAAQKLKQKLEKTRS